MRKKSVKRDVRLEIGEPWDFEIPGKGNVIEGRIEGSCMGQPEKNWQGEYLIVSLSETFDWKGEKVKQVLISPRYEEETIKDILRGQTVTVGIARIKPGVTLKASDAFTPQQVDYFAIGSVQAS